MPEFSYTVDAIGGRSGRIKAHRGPLEHTMVLPGAERDDGVTPEELVAGAWAACFGTTLASVARTHGFDAGSAAVRATVTFNADHARNEYSISSAELSVSASQIPHEFVSAILEETHRRCPVSKILTSGLSRVSVTESPGLTTVISDQPESGAKLATQ
jgi:organic hydroperoxide reductase OsmC/OhrA